MKNLLNEIKAMNRIAGTQMTKEQEIALIRERLQQLNELEFGTQKAFDSYQKQHDLRGDTKVTVAGKKMSVSQAVKQSGDKALKGSPVFGNNKGGEVFGKKMSIGQDVKQSKDPEQKLTPKEKGQLTRQLNKIKDKVQDEAEIELGLLKPGKSQSAKNAGTGIALALGQGRKKLQDKYNKIVIDKIEKEAKKAGITNREAIKNAYYWQDPTQWH